MASLPECIALPVFEYCGPAALARWACASRQWREEVLKRCALVLRGSRTLTTFQRRTLWRVPGGVTPLSLHCALTRVCALCREPWKGGFSGGVGVPGHAACVRDALVNAWYLRTTRDIGHMQRTLPYARLQGYHRAFGTFEYSAMWNAPHPAVPYESTVFWYDREYEHVSSAHRARLEAQRNALPLGRGRGRRGRSRRRN